MSAPNGTTPTEARSQLEPQNAGPIDRGPSDAREPAVQVIVAEDAASAAARCADLIADAVAARPDIVLGLATGETMRPVYARLVRLYQQGRVDFSGASTFNLDEYVGVAPDDPGSFHAYMTEALFRHVNLDRSRCRLPDGSAPDPQDEANRYDAAIAAAGGIDLQLLGIGLNGHLAFNEPGASFRSRTRVTPLSESTRDANAGAFPPGAMPTHAITLGLANILESRRCVLLATGARKAPVVARLLRGPEGEDCPATALLRHPATTVILDRAAAG